MPSTEIINTIKTISNLLKEQEKLQMEAKAKEADLEKTRNEKESVLLNISNIQINSFDYLMTFDGAISMLEEQLSHLSKRIEYSKELLKRHTSAMIQRANKLNVI